MGIQELAGQQIQHRRRERADDQMGQFDGEVTRAEEFVEEGDIIMV